MASALPRFLLPSKLPPPPSPAVLSLSTSPSPAPSQIIRQLRRESAPPMPQGQEPPTFCIATSRSCSHAMQTLLHPATSFPPPPAAAAAATTTSLHTALTTATTPTHLRQVHAQILRRTNLSHPSTVPLLVHLLLSSPSLGYALSVFRHVPDSSKTRVLNKFLRELSHGNRPGDTLIVFDEMWREGVVLDRFSFPPLLMASSKVVGLVEGSEIHGLFVKLGYGGDPFVQTAFVRMDAAGGRTTFR